MDNRDLGRKIPSGGTATFEFDIYKKKAIKGNKVILKYWDINFNERYNAYMNAAMSGASQEACRKQYPEFFDEKMYQTLEIPLV